MSNSTENIACQRRLVCACLGLQDGIETGDQDSRDLQILNSGTHTAWQGSAFVARSTEHGPYALLALERWHTYSTPGNRQRTALVSGLIARLPRLLRTRNLEVQPMWRPGAGRGERVPQTDARTLTAAGSIISRSYAAYARCQPGKHLTFALAVPHTVLIICQKPARHSRSPAGPRALWATGTQAYTPRPAPRRVIAPSRGPRHGPGGVRERPSPVAPAGTSQGAAAAGWDDPRTLRSAAAAGPWAQGGDGATGLVHCGASAWAPRASAATGARRRPRRGDSVHKQRCASARKPGGRELQHAPAWRKEGALSVARPDQHRAPACEARLKTSLSVPSRMRSPQGAGESFPGVNVFTLVLVSSLLKPDLVDSRTTPGPLPVQAWQVASALEGRKPPDTSTPRASIRSWLWHSMTARGGHAAGPFPSHYACAVILSKGSTSTKTSVQVPLRVPVHVHGIHAPHGARKARNESQPALTLKPTSADARHQRRLNTGNAHGVPRMPLASSSPSRFRMATAFQTLALARAHRRVWSNVVRREAQVLARSAPARLELFLRKDKALVEHLPRTDPHRLTGHAPRLLGPHKRLVGGGRKGRSRGHSAPPAQPSSAKPVFTALVVSFQNGRRGGFAGALGVSSERAFEARDPGFQTGSTRRFGAVRAPSVTNGVASWGKRNRAHASLGPAIKGRRQRRLDWSEADVGAGLGLEADSEGLGRVGDDRDGGEPQDWLGMRCLTMVSSYSTSRSFWSGHDERGWYCTGNSGAGKWSPLSSAAIQSPRVDSRASTTVHRGVAVPVVARPDPAVRRAWAPQELRSMPGRPPRAPVMRGPARLEARRPHVPNVVRLRARRARGGSGAAGSGQPFSSRGLGVDGPWDGGLELVRPGRSATGRGVPEALRARRRSATSASQREVLSLRGRVDVDVDGAPSVDVLGR
ncbi:uncharacterized protein BXZ73DRAFT_79233 [Epithele typhae]|uniref:uncharacterized protein n=1 Tax=Epithele typhae TaxID=378194 RepID=UPI0020078D80|nr:uncharacterized protein BXZ73DRAFT_79233 [Epithele typhae]KAH9924693.1 hypothetical protein BXZ73DRAFT_79233 [Epithele typhae]